jgi:hypothetical protein
MDVCRSGPGGVINAGLSSNVGFGTVRLTAATAGRVKQQTGAGGGLALVTQVFFPDRLPQRNFVEHAVRGS